METKYFKRILIAVDGSEHSFLVAEKGLALASQAGAVSGILFVLDKSKIAGSQDANITSGDAELLLTKEIVITFDSIASAFQNDDFIRFMPIGYPKEDILRTAEKWKADLIVIGNQRKSGIVNLFAGSVAEHVAYHTSIPVMIVR